MKGEKPSEFEVFDFCGPRHLTTVDWSKPDERKSVGASLVQGVYVLEGDRHKKRTGKEQLAPKWWEFFQFECIQTLKDKYDHSIFGAIFEYKPKKPSTSSSRSTPSQDNNNNNNNTPPKYVIAIRGTVMNLRTGARDSYLDVKIVLHGLNNSSRYELALDAIEGILIKEDHKDIWLAGHSLGAAIALQTGRAMAKMGYNIETYLFNPPYASAPIERLLKHRHLKHGARIAKSFITAGLSLALKIKHRKDNSSSHDDDDDDDNNNDPFATLRSWIPWMFVNPKDIICCEYAGYFEHREKMKSWGIGEIEKIAAKNSIMNLLMGVLGSDSEASYLIPSAFVSVNMKNMIVKEDGLLLAHGLSQWWEQHSCWQSKLYQCI